LTRRTLRLHLALVVALAGTVGGCSLRSGSDAEPATAGVSPATATVSLAGHVLRLPAGLNVSVFAEGLGAPRFMSLDDQGVLHVTDRHGRVVRLQDADGDGAADRPATVVDGLNNPHGITFHDGDLYVAEETRVVRIADANSDGIYESPVTIVDDLPDEGHWSRTIVFGPDEKLYLSVGSSCNVCVEESPIRAAIWRYDRDGGGGELFASGLRNAVGLAFSPTTDELWATNNGRDGMGDNVPPETLNRVAFGEDFGWPRCHAGNIIDPDFGSDGSCDGIVPPAVEMQAHSAPLGLAFLDSNVLGEQYVGDLLVGFHGSWNRSEPTGYKVVWLPFENGQPTGEVIDFVSGWLLEDGTYWGRPVDVIMGADGSVYISDDNGGRIFRVSRVD
jgi:glucose/arabinose dehydrogenase